MDLLHPGKHDIFFVPNAIELRIEARQNRLILSFHWYVPPSIAGFSIWMEIHQRFFARLQIPQQIQEIRNMLIVRNQIFEGIEQSLGQSNI